jgi:hypothetical protein
LRNLDDGDLRDFVNLAQKAAATVRAAAGMRTDCDAAARARRDVCGESG